MRTATKTKRMEQPLKIAIAPISIDGDFLSGTNYYINLYKNCLTYDHQGEYNVEKENTNELVKIKVDERRTIDKYAIGYILRGFDSYYGVFVIDIGGYLKINIKNRKRTDDIYNSLDGWRWGI